MTIFRLIPVAIKQVRRHRVRSLLTASGVAVAMFLFTAVQAMQHGVHVATAASADDTDLIVYRKDRYCPATSQLPQDYMGRIARLPGVTAVIPMTIRVSNCRTSLDVVTYRGAPKADLLAKKRGDWKLVSGSYKDWQRRTDAALVGQTLATRRGLSPGMTFDAAGITTYVAGIITSDDPQDRNVAYTALEFIQLAGRDQLGVVTQFNVKVTDPSQLEPVAKQIDELFASAQEPTATYSEKAFVGKIADEIVELVGFAHWLGLGCLAAVLALVANAIVLSAQSRVAEHAILQTLGFTGRQVGTLIVVEGTILSLLGGLAGGAAATAVARLGSFALSVEGQSIPIAAGPGMIAGGLAICALLGVLAGLTPAWQASMRPIVTSLRTI